MSDNKKPFKIEHLQMDLEKDHAYKGHLEGALMDQPFVYGSNDTVNHDVNNYDIPVFPVKQKVSKVELKKYLTSLKLTQHQKDALVACFLGKIASFPTKKDNRIRFQVSILKQKEFFCDLYEIFEPWAITSPVLHEKTSGQKKRRGRKKRAGVRLNKPRVRKGNVSMYFEIHGHPSFSYYKELFFMKDPFKQTKKLTKCVPKDINSMLTPRVLAYLFLNRGFFYPQSIDNTPFWKSYSFRLDHLFYYGQLIKVFSKKFNITLIRDLDDSHEIYNYNKKQRFTKLLYIRGDSRKKFIDLISPSLKKEYHDSLYASENYKEGVAKRQKSTQGLDYDYWFPVSSRKRPIGKFDTSKEPMPFVKKIIESTDKRTRWLVNGHTEMPEETFNTQLNVDKNGLPAGLLPKSYLQDSDYFLGNYGHWPEINPTHSFIPSFVSKKGMRDVVNLELNKKGTSLKSTFFKKTLKEVVFNPKEKDN